MWAIIGPLAKRHFNGVSLVGRYLPAYGGFGASLSSKKQNKQKTNLTELGPLWQNFLDPRMMFHILYLKEFIQKYRVS